MTTITRFLQVFALGTWVGSIVFLSFVVAPGAFATLPTRDQAGAVVGMALARLHVLGYVAGAVYLVVTAFRGRSAAALARPAVLVVVLMLALTLVSQQWVSPRLASLRVEMGSVHGEQGRTIHGEQGRTLDRTLADHPLRVEFNRLHQLSVLLETCVLLLGVAGLFLTVRKGP